MQHNNPFKNLFLKYRLRSEFETLNDFGNALADLNFIYENSIFSHWQKGTRIPKDRNLLLVLIKLFIERKAMVSLKEANEFIASTGQGYLTDEEVYKLPFQSDYKIPFQAPRLPDLFVGREAIIDEGKNRLLHKGLLVLQGPPGIGKTFIAIKLAHELADTFPDGIIWCNGHTNDPRKILNQIVEAFGEVLPLESTLSQTINLYRSIVSRKNALFIIDDLSPELTIEDLLPNSSQSSVIITIVFTSPVFLQNQIPLKIQPMNIKEIKDLYQSFIPKNIVDKNINDLTELATAVDNLPLLLVILAKQISYNTISVKDLVKDIETNNKLLEAIPYKENTLKSTLTLAFNNLTLLQQKILRTASLYHGQFFTAKSLSFAMHLPLSHATQELNTLSDYSFIEKNDDTRYRLHKLISVFLRTKKVDKTKIKKLCEFYSNEIIEQKKTPEFFFTIAKEVDNIVGIIKQSIEENFIDEVCKLWSLFGDYYWHVGHWQSFQGLSTTMYSIAKKYDKKELQLSICLEEVSRLYYYDGNILSAIEKAKEALGIAKNIENPYLIALAHQRYGKLCFINNDITEGIKNLKISGEIFDNLKMPEYQSHNLRYESEGYLLKNNFRKCRELLSKSLIILMSAEKSTSIAIYSAVLYSHLGILDLLQGNLEQAKEYFLKGVADDGKVPLVRGTYTWLSKLGLAVTFKKLGYTEEGNSLLTKATDQMKQLGIEKSYTVINVYANKLNKILDTL